MPQMIIANRLTDGRSVFLQSAGTWSEALAEGRIVDDPAEAVEWLAVARRDEAANLVVEPYLIEVGSDRRPLVWRELIRAEGPTVLTGAGAEGQTVVRAMIGTRTGSAGKAGKLKRPK
jgi:hypothetical protein